MVWGRILLLRLLEAGYFGRPSCGATSNQELRAPGFISEDLVETWEAIVTLAMFPVLCVVAFAADKGTISQHCTYWTKRVCVKCSCGSGSPVAARES